MAKTAVQHVVAATLKNGSAVNVYTSAIFYDVDGVAQVMADIDGVPVLVDVDTVYDNHPTFPLPLFGKTDAGTVYRFSESGPVF